ncbi:MAG: hypothetical protein ABI947_26935 [Chloroflexota bacterium]
METRYKALRLIVVMYQAIAILVFIITILLIILQILSFSVSSVAFEYGSTASFTIIRLIGLAGTFMTGSILAISLYAFANLIALFIDTEENTRLTAYLLRRIVAKSEKSAPISKEPIRTLNQ